MNLERTKCIEHLDVGRRRLVSILFEVVISVLWDDGKLGRLGLSNDDLRDCIRTFGGEVQEEGTSRERDKRKTHHWWTVTETFMRTTLLEGESTLVFNVISYETPSRRTPERKRHQLGV